MARTRTIKQRLDFELKEELAFSLEEVSLLGIKSRAAGFFLAGRMNRTLKIRFVKQQDFSLWNKVEGGCDSVECFYFESRINGCKYFLFETHNLFEVNVKQWKPYDYVLLIAGVDNTTVAQGIIGMLNAIDVVNIVQFLHKGREFRDEKPQNIETKQLTIFSQGEERSEETLTHFSNSKSTASKKSKAERADLESVLVDLTEFVALPKRLPSF